MAKQELPAPHLPAMLAGTYERFSLRLRAGKFCPLISFSEVSIISVDYQINEEIRDREVRLIDENGEQLGIVQLPVAMRMAEERELDLVKIAPQAKPVVCKLMDYSKYRFDMQKREKEARKNQKIMQLKEVRLSATIDKHDLDVKAKAAQKFLQSGDKVKVAIRFRGRQMAYQAQGIEVMDTFFEMIKEYATIERKPLMEGRNMIMILAPVNN
jgi:translation initiation factor IF-3